MSAPAPPAEAWLDLLLDPPLGPPLKGWPHDAPPRRASAVGAAGWRLLADDLPLPVAVLHRSALAHNLHWLQQLVDEAGLVLAPHGKTTMSPQLFRRQLAAGAWGMTVANPTQAAVAAAAGASRILIANQVLAAADLAAVRALAAGPPARRLPFLVDSAAQLAAIEAFQAAQPGPPFEVLIELGLPGGRSGVRGHDEALALARALHASPALRLVGIECYEGPQAGGDDAADRAAIGALMERLHALARALDDEGLFEADEVIVSAGGSAVFDLVAAQLKPALRRPVLGVLRSGCYLTHDHGHYRRLVAVVNRRLGCAEADGLRPALEVWARVQSRPEPGLALLNAGKRDLGSDIALPLPVAWSPAGAARASPPPAGWQVTALNDQHAYLRWPADAPAPALGDRIGLGISHPCTTFDRWPWLAVVDEDYRVVDAVSTRF